MDPLIRGLCWSYLKSQCREGRRCRHRHGPDRDNRGGQAYCRFYLRPKGECRNGDGCQYLHDPAVKAVSEFFSSFCPSGMMPRVWRPTEEV
jgi:hypothetical protein